MLDSYRRHGVALFTTAALLVGAAACGVSTSSPTKEGDALSGGSTIADTEQRDAPSPDQATSPEGLVTLYLEAAAGSIDQVKAFLTPNALTQWRDPADPNNPSLTVIRVVSQVPGTVSANRTPVTVTYQIVGTLNDQGRIEDINDLANQTMVFWVVPDQYNPSNVRVDQIDNAPPGLLLSDDALTEFYQVRPIYFWDTTYKVLIPDLRYVPLTIVQDLRASRVVTWLTLGPSPWLAGAQRLPPGTVPNQVISDNGTLDVKLSAQAGTGGPEGLSRLMYQLQWSLRTTAPSNIKLFIDGQPANVPVGPNDYLKWNQAQNYRSVGQRYDITDGKVAPSPAAAGPPAGVFAAPENASVVAAAVDRAGTTAAFVRIDQFGQRSMTIVRENGNSRVGALLPRSTSMGRPVFVPDGSGMILVPSAGRLYAVNPATGQFADVTPRNIGGITEVSVGPDGRRIAFVAAGQAYLATLVVGENNQFSVGNARPILPKGFNVTAVAWTTETWLYVSGTTPGGPVLWRVTADSVVARNLSDGLRQTTVTDLVAYPSWPPARGNSEVIAYTPNQGIYTYITSLTSESLHQPFYGG